jgi:hypothetical protein
LSLWDALADICFYDTPPIDVFDSKRSISDSEPKIAMLVP